MGLAPSIAGGSSPPPPPPCTLGPLPPPQIGPPRPGALQKEPRGVGGRGRERAGREGLWLEGRALQLQRGMGGALQTPVGARPTFLGAPKIFRLGYPNPGKCSTRKISPKIHGKFHDTLGREKRRKSSLRSLCRVLVLTSLAVMFFLSFLVQLEGGVLEARLGNEAWQPSHGDRAERSAGRAARSFRFDHVFAAKSQTELLLQLKTLHVLSFILFS